MRGLRFAARTGLHLEDRLGSFSAADDHQQIANQFIPTGRIQFEPGVLQSLDRVLHDLNRPFDRESVDKGISFHDV